MFIIQKSLSNAFSAIKRSLFSEVNHSTSLILQETLSALTGCKSPWTFSGESGLRGLFISIPLTTQFFWSATLVLSIRDLIIGVLSVSLDTFTVGSSVFKNISNWSDFSLIPGILKWTLHINYFITFKILPIGIDNKGVCPQIWAELRDLKYIKHSVVNTHHLAMYWFVSPGLYLFKLPSWIISPIPLSVNENSIFETSGEFILQWEGLWINK